MSPPRDDDDQVTLHDGGDQFNPFPHVEVNKENMASTNIVTVTVTETETLLKSSEEVKVKDAVPSDASPVMMNFTDMDSSKANVRDWDGTMFYSDFIAEGLKQKGMLSEDGQVVMLFESPTSYETEDKSTFHNKDKYRFHDWPPLKSTRSKAFLSPCRYAAMNGSSFPVFLRSGEAPDGLIAHWKKYIPGFVEPSFVDNIKDDDTVYAYLPIESIKKHVNDPQLHYHMAGKDSIVLMTQKTTKLLPDTKTVRPCVVKTTHSMASRGIFVIRDDEDANKFEEFLIESGNPTYVVTDFVHIHRNIACHFFIHPNGGITWFGSNENKRLPTGQFSSDSYLVMEDQQMMKNMQLPFVQEVAKYCRSLGFWGFCGVDVLFDSLGRGYLVDVNPRVTGSCPALMTLHQLNNKFGFTQGMFRRSGGILHYGTPDELLAKVDQYNMENQGKSVCILHSFVAPNPEKAVTKANIGVYGFDMDQCLSTINSFIGPSRKITEQQI